MSPNEKQCLNGGSERPQSEPSMLHSETWCAFNQSLELKQAYRRSLVRTPGLMPEKLGGNLKNLIDIKAGELEGCMARISVSLRNGTLDVLPEVGLEFILTPSGRSWPGKQTSGVLMWLLELLQAIRSSKPFWRGLIIPQGCGSF